MNYLGMGVSPSVPLSNGRNLMKMDKRLRLVELVLRIVICVAAIVSIALITTDTEVKEIFTIKKTARFTEIEVAVFLVVANVLAAAYSVLQVLRCVVSMRSGSVLSNRPLAWAIFSGDQIMAYLTLAAVAASSQGGIFAEFGNTKLQWMKVCNMVPHFCNQLLQGFAGAMLASVSLIILSAISAFSLFRLYDDKNGKSSRKW